MRDDRDIEVLGWGTGGNLLLTGMLTTVRTATDAAHGFYRHSGA
jgi:hypothetical protein